MDFVVEVVFQLVFEVLGEFLVEAGFHGAAIVLRSRIGRVVVASVVGFGAGLWWGARLSERGRTHEPRTLWISLALGVVAAAGAAWRWQRGQPVGEASVLSPPWRWPTYRLVGFSVLNAAVAAGVAVGFHPRPLG